MIDTTIENLRFEDSLAGTLWYNTSTGKVKTLLYYSSSNKEVTSIGELEFIGIDRSCAIMKLGTTKKIQAGKNFRSIQYPIYKVLAVTEAGESKVGWMQFGLPMKMISFEEHLK